MDTSGCFGVKGLWTLYQNQVYYQVGFHIQDTFLGLLVQ